MVDEFANGKIDWLASYPKSGNTWMRMLLANYFIESDEPHDINKPGVTNGIASSRWRFDELLGINSSDLTAEEINLLQPSVYELMVAENPDRQWIKVHDAYQRLDSGKLLFPTRVSGVAVYLIRNPLDVAVSMAFHDGHEDMERSVEKMCNDMATLSNDRSVQLPQFMGSWSNHVTSWVDQTAIPVRVIRYEDMLSDAARELATVISFARPEEVIDPARIAQAVDNASFDKLKTAEDENRFVEVPPKAKRFFRSGKSGDWQNHLSRDQVDRIKFCHSVTMRRFGYV